MGGAAAMVEGSTSSGAALLPVTIVTGFLGSGKTTLLNHLLTNQTGRRIGALVNEFGAVDVDSSLLASAGTISDGIVELANGCICCTINESLCDAVSNLLTQRAKIDYLLLETTGVADPGPVLQTLLLPQFASYLRVDGIVTMIDGISMARALSKLAASPPAPDLETSLWKQKDSSGVQLTPHEELLCFSRQVRS